MFVNCSVAEGEEVSGQVHGTTAVEQVPVPKTAVQLPAGHGMSQVVR